MGLKNKLFCRMAYAIRSAFFFFFFLTSYQSEKDGSELTPSCWKSLSFPCSRKADILKPKLGTFSPSQCCGWHKAGQFSLLHSLQSFIFSCPSCLEDDFLNPASRFFCWWALRSSSGAVFLSSFGVPRGQLQTWDICFWACLWANFRQYCWDLFQEFLRTQHLWESAKVPCSSSFWISLQGPEQSTRGNGAFFFDSFMGKDAWQRLESVLSSALCHWPSANHFIFLFPICDVTMIEMFSFFLPLSVLSIYILRSLGQGLSLDCTKADEGADLTWNLDMLMW